ncbi:TPA: anhydro-N-acetylmuramic acid kinase, partial [Klebsiella pneumoniae]|nr:anhydro-N-acetylmuramic acid kinase [Klebsiella pneumoniae]
MGLMSGTSLDGVDAVIMDFSGPKPHLVASGFTSMPEDLRKAIGDVCQQGYITLSKLGELDHRLGKLYAQSVNTLLRTENPFTMQIGDANLIAALTGITTVADFRRKDMAFAPLVPAFHQALFSRDDRLTVVLNIGGVSNISILRPGKPPLGYDTGPGNLLLDVWTEKHLGKPFDRDAAWAMQGTVSESLLHNFLSEDYFSRSAPKSTGRELFSLAWLEQKLRDFDTVSPEDVQATLVELTAVTISDELSKFTDGELPGVLMACGGGARNPLLISRLRSLFTVEAA